MSSISLADAKTMAQRYLNNKSAILKTQYDVNILPICETFDNSDITDVINQQGCTSFRIYYAMDSSLNVHAILVGVNNQGQDILNSSGPILKEEGQRCPPNCPPTTIAS